MAGTSVIDEFRAEYFFLSNFFPGGGALPTAEHQFQARKTLVPMEAIYIMSSPTAAAAKARGRATTLRPDWEEIKIDVMYEVLQLKFSVEPIRQQLLATEDAELIEGNTWGDTFWGVCRGEGLNILGELLMILRDEIRGNRKSRNSL